MRIEGMCHIYEGNDWLSSPSSKWHIHFVDKKEKATATKVGTREIYGIKSIVYSCNKCPHTFYAL